MKRDIIKIDEEKCVGCGLCVNACNEGALKLVDGKAKLISESYCDGLGNCLPKCPTDAITIEKREAKPFDQKAVKDHIDTMKIDVPGCPGCEISVIDNDTPESTGVQAQTTPIESQLQQWPCQIKLVPSNAPYFENCNLLIAADCTAYAYANIHSEFMKNKITVIGCPKLDMIDYTEKLTEIMSNNEIKSVSILKMEVPCCNGLGNAVKQALINSKKMIPWNITTISTDGKIVESL